MIVFICECVNACDFCVRACVCACVLTVVRVFLCMERVFFYFFHHI
jgi:hypothetical protein